MSKSIIKLCTLFSLVSVMALTTGCPDEETNNDNNVNECAAGEIKVTIGGAEVCKIDCSADATLCGTDLECTAVGSDQVCLPPAGQTCGAGEVLIGDTCFTDCSSDPAVCTGEQECVADGTESVCKDKAPEEDRTAPKCSDSPAPARCAATADNTTWAPASIVSEFSIADDDCCFDFNGDREGDNSIGQIIGILPADSGTDKAGLNMSLQEAIASGSLALVLEHDGVDPAAGGPFSIYFHLGTAEGDMPGPKADGTSEYKIDPVGLDQGTYPQAVMLADLEGADVTAGPGVITLNIELLGLELGLKLSATRVTAEVDATATNAGPGVFLNNGKLGGLLRIPDLFDTINTLVADECGCFTDGDGAAITADYIVYDAADIGSAGCGTETIVTTGCNADDEKQALCIQLNETAGGICNAVGAVGLVASFNAENTDVDCTIDETVVCDSVALGAEFSAVGATIVGVSTAAVAE